MLSANRTAGLEVILKYSVPSAIVVGFAAFLATGPTIAADCGSMPGPGIDWQDCPKRGIIIRESNLSRANLVETDFTSTDLRNSNLDGANLEGATLVRSSFAGSSANGANFVKVEGYRTDFSGVDAQGAMFTNAELQRVDFSGANLTGTSFDKAELGRANFEGANLTGSRFTLANLTRADLSKAKFTGPLDFANAFFYLTRLAGLDLSAATGLTQYQIDMACGDTNTKLPAGLTAPASWPCQLD
jgi:uncharacterized protein YjbI with pentapeptide repeats